MKKKGITASELMAKLNADPEFVAKRAREDEEQARLAAELQRAESPLVDDLRAVGASADSVWDLVNTHASYPRAIPVLLDHLWRPYPSAIREGIARALAVPEARPSWDVLTTMYKREEDPRVKDGLAVAVAGAADDLLVEDVIELARDARHGSSRLLLLSALARSSHPRARKALMSLGTDPDLKVEIQAILRRLKHTNR